MVSSIALPVLLRAPPIAGGGVDKAGERSRRDHKSLTSLEGGVAAQPAPSQKRHARRPRPDGESQCEVPDCEPSRVSRGHEIFSAMLGSEHGKYACQLIHSQ